MIEDQKADAVAKHRPRWTLPLVALGIGLVLLGAGIGVLALRYDRFAYPGAAMTHTLEPGSQLLVIPRGDTAVHRGDIVLVDRSARPESRNGKLIVSRVVAIGGDHLSCCDGKGRLEVNGHAITEDYLRTDDPGDPDLVSMPYEVTVPDGSVFLLGDWRGNAVDSRLWNGSPEAGSLPLSAVQGTVVGTFSLLGGTTPLEPTSAFTAAGLPGASTVDVLPVFAWWAGVVGLGWSVLAFTWVVATGIRRTS